MAQAMETCGKVMPKKSDQQKCDVILRNTAYDGFLAVL